MPHEFIRHLKQDHQRQRSLASKLAETKNPQQRGQLRKELYAEVYPHMVGEEASIFSFMKSSDKEEVREAAQEALQEHHVGKIILRELLDLSLESEVFSAKVKILSELNDHHMLEEEKEHFPLFVKLCAKEDLDRLYDTYEAAEEKAKK